MNKKIRHSFLVQNKNQEESVYEFLDRVACVAEFYNIISINTFVAVYAGSSVYQSVIWYYDE